jgi:branched-chain amino acid transport system permease protein
MRHKAALVGLAVLVAALLAVGIWGDRYLQFMTMRVMTLGIFALGYNLLLGRTGLLSFGHAAFFAAGGYGLALFNLHVSPDPLLGMLAGLAFAVLLAAVIGFFCVRHTEIYFAMLTLAFGMMFFSLVWNLTEITGGDDGLFGLMRGQVLGFISIGKDSHYYFFILFFFLLTMWLVWRIRQSPFGLILAGIRENERRVEFAGVAVKRYRLAVFVVSGAFAGLAGSLSTFLDLYVNPFAAHWSHSAQPILVSLIGGLGSFAGPIVGSVVFVALREVIERFTANWMLWFGVILLIIIMGFRGGIMGVVNTYLLRRSAPGKGGPA